MKLVSAAAMAAIDAEAQQTYGIPGVALMESAGGAAWRELARTDVHSDTRLAVLAGSGNNGGDALVMARYALLDGMRPTVVLVAGEPRGEAATNLAICRALGIEVLWFASDSDAGRQTIADADLIIDGISGTGIRGRLRDDLAQVVAAVNDARGRVVSLDVPSGLGDEYRAGFPVITADRTLTMGLPKRCLFHPSGRAAVGNITVVPVGFPAQLVQYADGDDQLLDPNSLQRLLPAVDESAHKGRRGVLWVFAGSVGSVGAATLAAESGARCRAGLVTLFADQHIYPIAASMMRSVMVKPVGTYEALHPEREADAYVVGPGWGTDNERSDLLRRIVGGQVGGVLDADALSIMSCWTDVPDLGGRWVLTPHPGEFARLAGSTTDEVLGDPFVAVREVAARFNAVVVLKAHVTIIGEPDGPISVFDGMNAALGTGGSGDVLAGIIGGLMAAGMGSADAARAGVVLHAQAGRELRDHAGLFLAEDLLACVSRLSEGL